MKRTTKAPPKSLQAQQDVKAMRESRRHDAVQLRKQRKGERLRRARERQRSNVDNTATATTITITTPSDATHKMDTKDLEIVLEEIISGGAYERSPQEMLSLLTKLHVELLATGVHGHALLDRLLQSEYQKMQGAVAFVSRLTQSLTNNITRSLALEIMLCLMDGNQRQQSASGNQQGEEQDDDSNYYGSTPQIWPDVFLSESIATKLFPALLSNLSLESVSFLLGDLMECKPTTMSRHLQLGTSWSHLVNALPTTLYACASILVYDTTTPGQQFLNHLTLDDKLTRLFMDPSTRVDAAWMVEGLSRREEQVARSLCDPNNALLPTLLGQMREQQQQLLSCSATTATTGVPAVSTSSESTRTNRESALAFLVPALRAIGNLVRATTGRGEKSNAQQTQTSPNVLSVFLSQPIFVEMLQQLLSQQTVLEAIETARQFLPQHYERTPLQPRHARFQLGIPALVPSLLSIVVAGGATLAWKRDALQTLNGALLVTDGLLAKDACLRHPALVDFRQFMLHQYLWTPLSERQRQDWMTALSDLLQRPDRDAAEAALEMADILLRMIPESRRTWEEVHGVDALEHFLSYWGKGKEGYRDEAYSSAVVDLLEDFYDHEQNEQEEEDDDNAAFGHLAPTTQANQFVFAAPPAPLAQSVFSSSGMGRGRPVVPSWMEQGKT